jgi:hypothetical protein
VIFQDGVIKEEDMDLGIKGKAALVTGGNRGIGKATALEMAKEGVNIAITGRDEADLAATKEEIQALGVQAVSLKVDMEIAADVEQAVAKPSRLSATSTFCSTLPDTPIPPPPSRPPMRNGPRSWTFT